MHLTYKDQLNIYQNRTYQSLKCITIKAHCSGHKYIVINTYKRCSNTLWNGSLYNKHIVAGLTVKGQKFKECFLVNHLNPKGKLCFLLYNIDLQRRTMCFKLVAKANVQVNIFGLGLFLHKFVLPVLCFVSISSRLIKFNNTFLTSQYSLDLHIFRANIRSLCKDCCMAITTITSVVYSLALYYLGQKREIRNKGRLLWHQRRASWTPQKSRHDTWHCHGQEVSWGDVSLPWRPTRHSSGNRLEYRASTDVRKLRRYGLMS